MKITPLRFAAPISIAILLLSPAAMCAKQESVDSIRLESIGAKTDAPDKGVMEVEFDKPIEEVQKAAVNALTVVGCKLRKQEPTYVEGKRSNKVGVAVGSGGETLKVWLTSTEADKTTVKVKTSKSLVGIVGQRNWDDEVIAEMRKQLGDEPAQP